MDVSTASIILDGVEFKISEALKTKRQVVAPNVHVKDVNVLLQKYNYDFSAEKHLVHSYYVKQQQLEEEKRKKEMECNLSESAQTSRNEQQMDEVQHNDESKKGTDATPKTKKISPTNPFFNDMMGNDILTPQKYTNVGKDSQSHQGHGVNVFEFEIENLDPFSNAELQTIDDLKELKDVLQHVTMGGLSSTSNVPPKPAPRVRRHSLTDKNEEVSIKVIKHQDDMSTKTRSAPSPTGNIHNPLSANNLSPLRKSADNLASPMDVSQSLSSATSMPTMLSFSDMDTEPSPSVPAVNISNPPVSFVVNPTSVSTPGRANGLQQEPKFDVISPVGGRQSPSIVRQTILSNGADLSTNVPVSKRMDIPENNYVNVSVTKPLPPVLPKPAVRQCALAAKTEPSSKSTHTTTDVSSSSVQNKILANKSKAERAKFEETINKALTSLPTLPKISFAPKVSSAGNTSAVGNVTTTPKVSPPVTSILSGLTASERGFAQPLVDMGFKEEDVIRSMQKCNKDQKDVLDHLFKLQCLSEKGFSTSNIEDALDLFQDDVEEAAKYLTLERQFLDMGFPCSKIKQALLLHNTDQHKALEELMSGV